MKVIAFLSLSLVTMSALATPTFTCISSNQVHTWMNVSLVSAETAQITKNRTGSLSELFSAELSLTQNWAGMTKYELNETGEILALESNAAVRPSGKSLARFIKSNGPDELYRCIRTSK